MNAKEEFYRIISTKFSVAELSSIKEVVKQLKEEITPNKVECDIDAFYYDLCGLFYSSGKNFNNFKANLINRRLPLDYTNIILQEENEKEAKRIRYYNDILEIITKFSKKSSLFHGVNSIDSITKALANAITPELLDQEEAEGTLNYYQECANLQHVSTLLNEGRNITRISFDVDFKLETTIKGTSVINNFCNDLVKFTSYRMHIPNDLDAEITRLQSIKDNAVKRVALRICMILVHYNILKETTTSHKYVLVNQAGKYISLSQNIMHQVYLLLCDLDQEFKERDNEYGSSTNTKYTAEKVKNLLRDGKKSLNDNFSYNDITDTYWGCFQNNYTID